MKKLERKKQSIVFTLGILPFCSTEQIARLFPELKYPQKEASKALKELEKEGMVEGYNRRMGESKIWRLTRKAKKLLDIKKRSIPLTVRKAEHYLHIGTCYFDLLASGGLSHFECEPRIDYVNKNMEAKTYSPDGLFMYKGESFFLEVQRSYLSRINWAKKWRSANQYASSNADENMPKIIVISFQRNEVVKTGSRVKMEVFDEMKNFCLKKT